MRKPREVTLPPDLWTWEAEVLGNVSPGPEEGAARVRVDGLGSRPVPAEEGARLREDHGREDEAGTGITAALSRGPFLFLPRDRGQPGLKRPAPPRGSLTAGFLEASAELKSLPRPYQVGAGTPPPHDPLPVGGRPVLQPGQKEVCFKKRFDLSQKTGYGSVRLCELPRTGRSYKRDAGEWLLWGAGGGDVGEKESDR